MSSERCKHCGCELKDGEEEVCSSCYTEMVRDLAEEESWQTKDVPSYE